MQELGVGDRGLGLDMRMEIRGPDDQNTLFIYFEKNLYLLYEKPI